MDFLDNVRKYIDRYGMLSEAGGVVVGLSGGADSVCLLLCMCELVGAYGMTASDITAVHVNHMIRGEEADKDEAFARCLCDRLGVRFVAVKKNVTEYAGQTGMTVEEAGRAVRYESFMAAARYGRDVIAVAHNKNDLAETVLFNMARGSGIKGICGIPPVRGGAVTIIRPLLGSSRQEIEDYLKSKHVDFRTDSTNLSLDYDRNRIRHIILPELMKLNTGAMEHICRLSEEADRYHELADRVARAAYGDAYVVDNGKAELDIERINRMEQILKSSLIYGVVTECAGKKKDISKRHIDAVLDILTSDTGRRVNLPYGLCARKSYDKLIIEADTGTAEEYSVEIGEPGIYCLPDGSTIEIRLSDMKPELDISKKIYTKMADYDKIKDTLCIRSPKQGDYITIDSTGKKKKLSRVFIDCKIDRNKRDSWPVVADGDSIVWAVGLRDSSAYRIDENTGKVLYMIYNGKGEEYGRED